MPARGPFRPLAFLLALAVTGALVAGIDALATPGSAPATATWAQVGTGTCVSGG